MTTQQLRALTERAFAEFGKYPNVHAVAIGNRERGGREVKELVLIVFVTRKVARNELAPDAVIPAEFEGLPTDVVEMGTPELADLGDIPGVPADDKDEDKGRYRPLKGGIQLSGSATGGKGTLGLLAKTQNDSRVMAVTNWHVLFDNSHPPSTDVRVGNPDTSDSCTRCVRGSFGHVVAQDYTAVDAAIAELDPGTQWLAEIQCIGYITGWNDISPTDATSGSYQVRKYGRTTRLTGGVVQAVGFTASISSENRPTRHYSNGILIKPNRPLGNEPVKFGDKGDSGSAVVNAANEVVGVLFAIFLDRSAQRYGWGLAFPVNDMASQLRQLHNVEIVPATATRLGDVQTVPGTVAAGTAANADDGAATALAQRLERELSSSEQGRLLAALWMRHSNEVRDLINQNRRVAALWRRHRGPGLIQEVVRAATIGDEQISAMIDGRPIDECAGAVVDVLLKYGSEDLKSDLRQYRTTLPVLAGRSYQDILSALATGEGMSAQSKAAK